MIGVLGGTFDPIHAGHMHIAEQVESRLPLTELHFLPCATPVHRDIPQVSDAQRVQMIELAIAGISKFKLNHLELERGRSILYGRYLAPDQGTESNQHHNPDFGRRRF